ncbi:hypothetical protein Tco_0853822 [Tanacetum coccineum]
MDCILIGYAKNSSAYHFIVHDLKNPDIQKNTVMESRNASFFENIFPCLTKETGSSSRIDDEVVLDKRERDDNVSSIRDKINLRKKRLNQEEVKRQEPRNHLDPVLFLLWYTSNPSDAHWKDMTRINQWILFTLGGVAISWKSSKQTVIAKSTMESEFIALDKCEEEAE